MLDFLETLQFGKKVTAHGKEWNLIKSVRQVFKEDDGKKHKGEYVLAVPYGSEMPSPVTLIFISSEVKDEVGKG